MSAFSFEIFLNSVSIEDERSLFQLSLIASCTISDEAFLPLIKMDSRISRALSSSGSTDKPEKTFIFSPSHGKKPVRRAFPEWFRPVVIITEFDSFCFFSFNNF